MAGKLTALDHVREIAMFGPRRRWAHWLSEKRDPPRTLELAIFHDTTSRFFPARRLAGCDFVEEDRAPSGRVSNGLALLGWTVKAAVMGRRVRVEQLPPKEGLRN